MYLTFDDGPTPNVTARVLDLLAGYQAKATFFCVGSNVIKHPHLMERLTAEGHEIGNHTFNHESCWESSTFSYLRSFRECQELTKTKLFRPPYGRIKRDQVRALKEYTNIIMWDILSGDFDSKRTPERCAETVIKYGKPGSIVVFHDSKKAEENVLNSLPMVLEHFHALGYRFLPLSEDILNR